MTEASKLNGAEASVSVRFFTRQSERHVLPQVSIMVPTRLRRYGLSEVINHLLGRDKPIPFDFLIEKQLIRGSLQQYLDAHQLSTENTLSVEVIESLVPPKNLASYEHDEWLSSVDVTTGNGHGLFLTGCYDNQARLWNATGQCVATLSGHSGPVKAVRWLPAVDGSLSALRCATASQDQTVRVWDCRVDGNDAEAKTAFELQGHEGSVDALDARGTVIITGSWDTSIRLWSSDPSLEEHELEQQRVVSAEQSSKRRRGNAAPLVVRKATAVMNGHAGPVSCIVMDRQDPATTPSTFYSGSWDHTVRTWDLESRVFTKSISCDHVVTSIDHSSHNGLLATGHSDRLVRLWDPRSKDGTMVKLKLASHMGWVSSVSWSPHNSYNLLSGSYDGSSKIWDIRSTSPIYTIAPPTKQADGKEEPVSKVLAVQWCAFDDLLVSGGEDGKLHIHSYSTGMDTPSAGQEEVVGK